MTFSNWCNEEFGIVDFMEGKIPNSVLLPGRPSARIIVSDIIRKAGGYSVDTPYLRGIIISREGLQQLKAEFFKEFSTIVGISDDSFFKTWMSNEMYLLGVDLAGEKEYRDPSNIHLTFATDAQRIKFLDTFSYLNPIPSFNPISKTVTLQVPANSIYYLKQLYYQNQSAKTNTPQDLQKMSQQVTNLKKLKSTILGHHLASRLDYANFLSRDHSTPKKAETAFYDFQAASAYALSLRVYAEINRDNLSEGDYQNLIYVSSILAAYNDFGHLEQSLKTDAYFVSHLARKLYSSYTHYTSSGETVFPVLATLDWTSQEQIKALIQQNITNMLHGNPHIPMGNGAYFSMKRFLPDEQMRSDTDELIFQGGGMRNHSALFRIIKVGCLADGTRAKANQKPLYYTYYKVVDNLGAGCEGIDRDTKTCYGTYVTSLYPFYMSKKDVLTPATVNPITNPVTYQKAMEFTLRELITVERQMMFYRMPGTTPEVHSPEGSDEGKEWQRLNYMNKTLSGQFEPNAVNYLGHDPINPTRRSARTVQNQRNFYQEGGSCLVFALKSLVSSILGTHLSTLHSNFMQLKDAQGHLSAIDIAIEQLEKQIAPQMELQQQQQQTRKLPKQSFFSSHHDHGLQMIKNSALEGAYFIRSATVENFPAGSKCILLSCENEEQTNVLIKSISARIKIHSGLTAIINTIYLDEQTMQTLCISLKLPYESLVSSLPAEVDNLNIFSKSTYPGQS